MSEDEQLSDISPQTRDQLQQNTLSALTLHRLNLIYDFTYRYTGRNNLPTKSYQTDLV